MSSVTGQTTISKCMSNIKNINKIKHIDNNKYPRMRKDALPDEFEGTPKFESILSLARSSPAVDPPRDFSQKLMSRLSEGKIDPIQTVDERHIGRFNDSINAVSYSETASPLSAYLNVRLTVRATMTCEATGVKVSWILRYCKSNRSILKKADWNRPNKPGTKR